MALVSYILTPEGFTENYFKNLKLSSSFVYPRITKNTRFLSRQKKLDLVERSVFKTFSVFWKTLDSAEKTAWSEAAAEVGLNNWQLFVHDTAARKKFDYEGLSIPNTLHQGYVGWIHIEEPDDELKITQLHPKFYWVMRLASGHKRSWEPVKITEDFALPLQLQLNYYSDLVAVAEEYFAKAYCLIWHSYQGVDYQTELAVDLDLQSDWKNDIALQTSLLGQIIHYDVFIHLKGLTGELYFDNIKVEHSGQNWLRDSRCDDISKIHPRTWFLIPERWTGVIVPDNSFFQSIYYDF
jgi:hypothetical protein